jgi:hypothetical protein
LRRGKAAEGRRSPRPGGNSERFGEREASWSAPVLWRFGRGNERGNVIGIVSAKLNASAALAASGALPENVNYAVKSSFLLSFLESVPDVSARLKAPVTADRKFENVVKSAQDAAVLVLVN